MTPTAYSETHEDIIKHEGNIYFRASTYCERLGYKNVRDALSKVGPHIKLPVETGGGTQKVSFVDQTQAILLASRSNTLPLEDKKRIIKEVIAITAL